jgi:hypothetical protein
MNNTWRDIARPIIADVLQKTRGSDESIIRKALYDAYPFGARQYHPYKVWLDEIKVQRKKKQFGKKAEIKDPNQKELF